MSIEKINELDFVKEARFTEKARILVQDAIYNIGVSRVSKR